MGALTPVARADALPSVSLALPAQTMIGEGTSFAVSFKNSGTTGYGPFIDLVLPGGASALTFGSATYLGVPVTATVLTFPDDDGAGSGTTGHVLHPYAVDTSGQPLAVYGTAGDQLVVLQLPFGSYTPGQPAADLTVNALLSSGASLGGQVTVRARAGFQFGNTPVNDPATDPSIVSGNSDSSTWTVASMTVPTVLKLRKEYSSSEGETATGANFERTYRLVADVASGQTVTGLTLTDALPSNLQFVSIGGISPAGNAGQLPSTTVPGGQLSVTFPSVTGGAGADDAVVTFSYYVPQVDAGGQPVVSAATGAAATSHDSATAQGTWKGISVSGGPAVHDLQDRSLAIQKGVAIVSDTGKAGLTPGDTLEYTLSFEVSDYFAFQNLRIPSDVLSDGQQLDASFTPQFSVTENGTVTMGSFGAERWTSSPQADGTTLLSFDISSALVDNGRSGQLLGGLVQPADADGNDGPTTGWVRFRTTVLDAYRTNYPSGDASLDEGDAVSNSVTISGGVLDTASLLPTGSTVTDGSAASLTVPQGSLSKTVYAINGSTTLPNPLRIAPGDLVTYRVVDTLTTGDFEALHITDYLPLPIFSVATYSWSKDASAALTPGTGTWKFGPSNNRPVVAPDPVVTASASSNALDFNFGTYDDASNAGGAIDLLFTVQVSSDPFADGLFLTNQAQVTDQNTEKVPVTSGAIVQVQLTEPVLSISKGAVAADHPGAVFNPAMVGPVSFTAPGTAGVRWSGTIASAGLAAVPVKSSVSGVDAADTVTFAIVVENKGTGLNGAFDVRVVDTLPAGYSASDVTNLTVTDGTGAAITTANVGGGAGLFDQGLELVDPGATATPTGVLDPYDASSGRNIAVITYDLKLKVDLASSSVLTNTVALVHYAGMEGGANDVVGTPAATATVTAASPTLAKTRTGSELTGNNNNDAQAVVGELITYEVTLTFPEGVTPAATVVDNLGSGLAYVGPVTVTNSDSAHVSFSGTPGSPAVSNNGGMVTFSFGDVTDTDTSNATAETVTLRYPIVVLNVGGNTPGTSLHNTATLSWTGGAGAGASAPNTQLVEPQVTIVKSASPSTGDAGDEVTFSISVTNMNVATGTDAFDVSLSDVVPSGLVYVAGSLSFTAGTPAAPAPVLNDSGAPALTATWSSLPWNTQGTITFKAALAGTVAPRQTITNSVNLTYTTLPGTPAPSLRSSYNSYSTERTLSTSSSAGVTVASLADSKGLAATSEDTTSSSDVTIGEIVRYHLAVKLPEGQSTQFEIVDALPAGLTFLNDGTTKVAFVASGSGTDSGIVSTAAGTYAALSGAGLQVVGAGSAVTPSFVVPAGNITPGTFADGTDPVFHLGTLTNYDRDSDDEYVVLEFNAIVSNVAANVTNRNLDNTFTVNIGGNLSGFASNSVRVTVRQPSLATTKTITHAPVDAGDTATYQIVVTNTGNATAFDVDIKDLLSAYLDLRSTDDVIITTDDTVVPVNASQVTAGVDTVEVTASSLAAGKTITVTVTVHVVDNLPDGQLTIDNMATTAWTSLPGSGTSPNETGSVAGTPGSSTGERTGTGTAPNTYVSSSTATMTLRKPVHLYKDIVEINGQSVGSRPYTVEPGNTVRFRLRVENQGAQPIYNTDLYDTLPTGWTISAGTSRIALTNGAVPSSWTTVADPHGSPYQTPPTAPTGTSNVQWHVQQTVAATDDAGQATGSAKDTLYLEFVATVTSSASGSPAGTQNLNQADMAATTDAAGATQLPSNVIDKQYASDWALVYKPQLLITKSVVSIGGNSANVTQAQAGDTVTYRIIVRNTSAGAAAAAVSVTDTIPSTMTYVAGSSTATWSGGSSTADPTGTPAVWTWAASRIAAGQNLVLTYSVRVVSTTALGRNTNSASASAHDTSTGTLAATAPDGSGSVSAQIDVHKPVVRVTKTASAAGVAVGTPVDFTIKLESLDSYAAPQGVGLVDTLPAGWTYTSGTTFVVKNNGASPASWGSAVANPTIAGQALTWNLASALDATDDQGGGSGQKNDTLWLKFTAVPGPTAEGTANVNTVSASFKDGSGTAMPSVQDSVTICVGSPRLEMTKVVDQNTTGVNQSRTFTLKVVNQNAVPANSVNVDDYLPAGWQFASGSASWVLNNGASPAWPDTVVTPAIDGTRLTFGTGASIAGTDDAGGTTGSANDTLWIQFQAMATGSAVQGVNTNTAVATGTDPGNHPVGSSMGSVPVNVNKPELSISKAATPTTQVVGQNVTYTITVRNTGNEACTSAVVTDSMPAQLAYVSSSPVATVSSGTVTFGAVSVPANGTVTFTVVAKVIKNAPDGAVLTNSASVSGKDSAGNTIAAGPATTNVTVSAPTLSVSKTGSPNPVKAGGTLEYSITVTNSGSQAATAVTITDPVPAYVTFGSADNGGVNSSGVITWTGLTVPAGASVTLHWSGTVASPIPDNTQLTNTATVDSSEAGPVSSAPAVNVVSSAPALNICKTASQNPVRAGNTFTYTIRYANTSTMDVTGAVITEAYPAGITFVSASPAPTSGDNVWSIGNLGAGSSGNITVTVSVGAGVADGSTLNNVVTLTSNDTRPVQSGVSTTVGTAPALHITKDDLEDPAPANGTVTYRLTWSNTGSTPASGVSIIDDFSGLASLRLHGGGTAPVAYASFATNAGSPVTFTVNQSGTLLTFTPVGGSLPGMSTGWIDVTFNVPAGVENGSTGTNKVTLKSTETNDVTDTESTTFSSLPALHIAKTGPSSVTPGGTVTYHIEYWNDGAAPATGVVIAETYGSYLEFKSATIVPDTGTDNLWSIGTVGNDGVHHTIDVTCTVASPLPNGTQVANTATMHSDQVGPQTATSTGTVGSGPLLTITKTVTGSPVTPGQNLVYTVTIGNTGTAAATGVTVTDTLPSSATYVSARFVSGSGTVGETSGMVTWTLTGSLAPGQQVVVELVAKVISPQDTGTTITNTADVVCTEDPTVREASVPATVSSAPLLHFTKDAPANANAGDAITYSLHVTNTGTMNAHGVVVTDTVPAHTTLVSASFVSGGTGTVDTTTTPGTVKWTLDPAAMLNVGSELVLQLVVQADTPLPNGTVIANTAGVTSTEVTTPVNGTASTTIGSAPVLAITKTVTPGSFTPGGQLTYTITLSNTGNMDATGVTIVDITPPHTTFVSAVFTDGTGTMTTPAAGSTGQVTWTPAGGTLARNAHVTVTLVLQTANPLPNGTVITNTAIGDSAETQQVTSDAMATAGGAPILTLTKTAFPFVQAPGGSITWALSLHNSGTSAATGVVVTESYDALFVYQFANPAPDAGTSNRWTVGDVAPGATVCITVIGLVSPTAVLTTPAQVVHNTATAACAELSPVSASAAATVQAPSFWDPAHVTNYKAVSPSGNVGPGTRLLYTNFYGNAGNAPATNATITDYLDPNLDESTLSITGGGSYDAGTRTISWVLPVVPAGATGSVGFTVVIRSGFDGGYIYNRSSVGLPGQVATVTNTVTTWVYPAPVTPPTPPTPPVAGPAVTLKVTGPENAICVKKPLNLGVSWPDGTAPFAWTVDYGDGSALVSGTTNQRQLTLTHQYAAVGSYVVTVKVTAAGAAQSSYQATVTVTPCPETLVTVYHQNFFIGYPDKPFLPERPISRAEVAGALTRALGLGWSTVDPHYGDLAYTHWATGFIALMQEEGIMMGDTGGTFRPDAFITRAEAAAVFLRLLRIAPAPAGMASYPDVPADHWAAGVIAAMKNVGLIAGYPDGTFHPNDQIKRSEFAVLACRALGRQIQPANELRDVGKLVHWEDVPETYWAYWAIMEVSTPHLVTSPVRLTQLIQLNHKTIPLYAEDTDSIVTFLRLGDTVTAIVPVDGLQSTGADPVARKVQVKIINHDRP
jgi:uncharacterized repeat protein (TIGR01451 family)/fimbrial isopeptide formation D2 family protein